MKFKHLVFAILSITFLSSCLNVGSYYVDSSKNESFDIIENEYISMGYGAILVKDTLIFSIDYNIKSFNEFRILELGFTINGLAISENKFKKKIYSVGYNKDFGSINSIANLNSIVSTGEPVKLVYKIHREEIRDLGTLQVQVNVLYELNKKIKSIKASNIIKRRTRYKIIAT